MEGSWGCRGRGRIPFKTVELKYHVRGGVRAAESTLGWRCQLGVISLEVVIGKSGAQVAMPVKLVSQ